VEVGGKTGELTYRIIVTIRRYCDKVGSAADIDPGGIFE
jgi:hypothetical protein